MEARWLFDVPISRIQVTVHPQSILHSAVEFEDGAIIGQMGTPDMRLPILYALYYPYRQPLSGDKLDLFDIGTLEFEKPDFETAKNLIKNGTMYNSGVACYKIKYILNKTKQLFISEYPERPKRRNTNEHSYRSHKGRPYHELPCKLSVCAHFLRHDSRSHRRGRCKHSNIAGKMLTR